MAVQRKIFISYRQADNPDFVDRIRDRLTTQYGDENVFMDFISIPPGVQFADYLRDSMRKCDAVVAIIGPKWVELFKEKAGSFQDDYVRIELGLALELDKPIVPICIAGAKVPAASDLPPELRPLLKNNFAFLERTTFADRIPRVLYGLEAAMRLKGGSAQNKVSTGETPAVKPTPPAEPSAVDKLFDDMFKQPAAEFLNPLNVPKPAEAALSAEDYYNRALDHEAAGNRDGAIADYSEALRLNPRDADSHNNLANLLMENGDMLRAMGHYNRAVQNDPTSALHYNNRGLAHYRGVLEPDYALAIADFTEAIRLQPDYDQPYLNRGAAYAALNDYAAAVADYTEAIRLNPTLASAYYNRGIIRKELGDIDAAIDDYRQASLYAPDDPTIYNNLGIAYSIKGDPVAAIMSFGSSIILKNPEPHLPLFNRANVQFDLANYPAAIKDYGEAIRLKPQFAPAYLSRGGAYYHSGDIAAAIADYEAYLRLQPDDQSVEEALKHLRAGTNPP